YPPDGYRSARAADAQLHPKRDARSLRGAQRRDGRGPGPVQGQHRAQDLVAFLREIEASVEPTLDIHVVLDNLSAHKAPPVQRWLLRHPRVQFHFTPTYASWLNLVERFFGLLTEKALKRGSHTSIAQLRAAILAYVVAHNERGTPFKWIKTADQILDSMRRFGLRVQQVHGQ